MSKTFLVITYILYLIIGAILNNLFVRNIVEDMVLNEIESDTESSSIFDKKDVDSLVSFMTFIIGIIFELFWPIFMVMWIIEIIKILLSRKPK